jgi:hypothetical protein
LLTAYQNTCFIYIAVQVTCVVEKGTFRRFDLGNREGWGRAEIKQKINK